MGAFPVAATAFGQQDSPYPVEQFLSDQWFVLALVFDAAPFDVAEVVAVLEHGAEAVDRDGTFAVAAVATRRACPALSCWWSGLGPTVASVAPGSTLRAMVLSWSWRLRGGAQVGEGSVLTARQVLITSSVQGQSARRWSQRAFSLPSGRAGRCNSR